MDIVDENVPVWNVHFPREIIPISEMLLKARIGTAGHLLMGPFTGRREERGQRCGPRAAPRYKLVMQIHSLYFTTGLQHRKNTLNPNNSASSRDQKSLGDQCLIKYIIKILCWHLRYLFYFVFNKLASYLLLKYACCVVAIIFPFYI